MSTDSELQSRSESKCELCAATNKLSICEVPPSSSNGSANECILVCDLCLQQVDKVAKLDVNHWRCLNDSMWSQVPAVQVVAWRMLTRLSNESWAQNLIEMMYLDDATLSWAKATGEGVTGEIDINHLDSNGVLLQAGDTVTLTKDLNVKGAGFTAKRGTAVRGISLVIDNAEHIEGRVNGQKIVILTKFVKKST